MRKRDENADEISKNPRTKNPLFYVATGAIFLFALIVLGAHGFNGSAEIDTSILLSAPPPQTNNAGVLSAYLASGTSLQQGSPDLLFVGSGSLMAAVPPGTVTPNVLGTILGGSGADTRNNRETTHYVIQQGDTVSSLAAKFGISENTILWANDLSGSATLEPGDELIILPVSGALHLVRPGDTMSEIALWYKSNAQEILQFNGVESEGKILVGDILIIPGGQQPSTLPNGRLTEVGGIFLKPVPRSYKTTQGLHPFNAVDFANGSCGGPAYAAAGGSVQIAGYNSGLGNYVRILHPNGVVTVYAHLSSQAVGGGEKVSQGQTIGYIGHTGHTIPAGPAGCHLHFEVRGASNPFR